MPLWQKSMIALARSHSLTSFMHKSRLTRSLSRQFVGGDDPESAIARGVALRGQGITASMFFLGEYVEDEQEIQRTLNELLTVMAGLPKAGLDLHVSVDPTQVGSMISWDTCRENVTILARDVAEHSTLEGRNVLMLDMEDSSVTQHTLELYHALRDQDLHAAVTLQAYLHRSEQDLERLIQRGAMVRLVKGAFAEPAAIAHTTPKDRDKAYRAAIRRLLSPEARERGVYPVVGTHDHRMVEHARETALANGLGPRHLGSGDAPGRAPRLSASARGPGRIPAPVSALWPQLVALLHPPRR